MRFVDPSPKLAQFLAERGPKVLPEIHEWAVEWIADVGTILRSREFMAYSVASIISGVVLGV